MKKIPIFFVCWFVLLLLLSALVSSPLHYWRNTIQSNLIEGVILQQIDGRLWDGDARVSLPRLMTPVDLQWRFNFPLINVQVTHPLFQGWGAASIGLDGADIWVDQAQLDMGLFKPVAQSNGVSLNGSSFIIDRLFINVGYDTFVPRLWRGEGSLETINADYRFNNDRKNIQIKGITVEWLTQEQESKMLVRSQEGKHLLTLEPTHQQELEIAIMPPLLNEVGINWSGKADYPVAVLVEPLF